MTKDGLDLALPDTNDLRSCKGIFIQEFIKKLDSHDEGGETEGSVLSRGQKYQSATTAWMASHLRATLMAARAKPSA